MAPGKVRTQELLPFPRHFSELKSVFEKKGTDLKVVFPPLHDPKFSPSSAGSAFPTPSSILFRDQLLPGHISTGISPTLSPALLKTTFLLFFPPPSLHPALPQVDFPLLVFSRLSLTPLHHRPCPDFNRADKEKEIKSRVRLSPSGELRAPAVPKPSLVPAGRSWQGNKANCPKDHPEHENPTGTVHKLPFPSPKWDPESPRGAEHPKIC